MLCDRSGGRRSFYRRRLNTRTVLCTITRFIGLCNCVYVYTVRGARPGKNVQLSEGEIRGLCLKSREIFLSQPILLELEAPLKICGELLLYMFYNVRLWLPIGHQSLHRCCVKGTIYMIFGTFGNIRRTFLYVFWVFQLSTIFLELLTLHFYETCQWSIGSKWITGWALAFLCCYY